MSEPRPEGPPTDEPGESLTQVWPWIVYTTAYGLRIRHGLTGTELDLYEAAKKLNDYDSERRASVPPTHPDGSEK